MLKGAAAAGTGLGAFYFGYEKLKGERVRVGFIGSGDEGSVLLTQHPPEYMEIVAVADIRPTNLERAKHGDGNEDRAGLIKKLGEKTALTTIKYYSDYRDLLARPDIEAVVIATPLISHHTLAIEAMKAGKHVLCEKLMAKTVTDCKSMIKAAKDTGKLLAVGHQRHYSVLYDNAYSIIKMGLLGDIKHIRAVASQQQLSRSRLVEQEGRSERSRGGSRTRTITSKDSASMTSSTSSTGESTTPPAAA